LKKLFTQNVGWKLFSLAAAVLLWIAVASEPELSTFISLRVEYKNLPTDLEIDSDVIEPVLLELRGPSGELRSLPEARLRYAVILDMSAAEPGQHTFSIDSGDVRLPRGVQLVRAIPAQIRLDFEHTALRRVPVTVRFAGGLPPDLAVLAAVPEPALLAITGPMSRVARIQAVETDPLHVKPAAGVAEYRVEAFVNEPRVRFQDSSQVTVKVTVGKK